MTGPRLAKWLAFPILLRIAIFAGALVALPWSANPARFIPAWAQNLQALCFTAVAFVLLVYGRGDRRAWALGLFILDAAATLLSPFVRLIQEPPAVVVFALHMRTDAFQAALIWFFAGVFPSAPKRPWLANAFHLGTIGSTVLGALLAGFDLYRTQSGASGDSALMQVAQLLQRSRPQGDWYFTLQFLSLAPLLALMPLKLRESGPNDRRRFVWLALGIVVGYAPLMANTFLYTAWPWYGAVLLKSTAGRVIGAVIVIALTVVPVAAAYAALVQRTLDVRLVLRKAAQYVLARSFIVTLAAAPLVALIAVIASNRTRPVVDLVSGPAGLALAALAALGFMAAVWRRRLLAAVDRRFFRQQVDGKAMLLGVAEAMRDATSLETLTETLGASAEAAFHPATLVTVVAGSDDHLHAVERELPPLPRASALAQIIAARYTPFEVGSANDPLIGRLPGNERDWLRASGAAVIVPLRGTADQLLGMLALGEKKSELPYGEEDRALLAAVGTSGGLAMDRILAAARAGADTGAPADNDPPARECVECGTVMASTATACLCGGLLQRAAAPYTLGDRLRFVRRIGEGGMGVVYRALDLRLQQSRAVKTLSGTDPALTLRLRREARSMASARHANLATLHSLELWRGVPLLVMEYLEGGTLGDRIRRQPLGTRQMLVLGISVCDGLTALHGAGVLHRDIKPSNIGFTGDGVPKLLDFGLAKVSTSGAFSGHESRNPDDSTRSATFSTEGGGFRGTPAYLSPEVLAGAAPSVRDDLWSLALTLLESCTGNNPFRAATVAGTVARVLTDSRLGFTAAAALPEPVRSLFSDLLGPPERRPQSAQHLAQRLQQCL